MCSVCILCCVFTLITSIQYFTHAYNLVLELSNLMLFRVFKLMSCMSMFSL